MLRSQHSAHGAWLLVASIALMSCGKETEKSTNKTDTYQNQPPPPSEPSTSYLSEADVAAKLEAIKATRSADELEGLYITATGHGAYLTSQGSAEPELAHILITQERVLERLHRHSTTYRLEPFKEKTPRHPDAVIARGQHIVEWIDKLEPPTFTAAHMVQRGLLEIYQRDILDTDPDALVTMSQKLSTGNSGQAYVDECNMNGVPTPDTIKFDYNEPAYDPANGKPPLLTWINWGLFSDVFVSPGPEAQLWSMEFSNGVCLALPRWSYDMYTDTYEAGLSGLVCLGYQTGKACYFDYTNLQDGEERTIQQAISGAALVNHTTGGMCTNCHAGNNSFIVHPEKTPFANLIQSQIRLNPSVWPDPIAPASWVKNPGPLRSLGPIPNGEGSCTSCHSSNTNLQFPSVSQDLSDYCSDVLNNSIGGGPASQTMPPSYASQISYNTHIQRLETLCGLPATTTTPTTDIPADDPAVVSTPLITTPVYACSNSVHVYGARVGSTVTLLVNGKQAGKQIVADPDNIEFILGSNLSNGDQLRVIQTSQQGVPSAPTTPPVDVYSHTVDYPNGLPTPRIDPTIVHECGRRIAVRHVPGARLHVRIGLEAIHQSTGTAKGWSVVSAARDFVINDGVRVGQSICSDESLYSNYAYALPAPSPLSTPTLDPPDTFDKQKKFKLESLTHSADIIIEENSLGQLLHERSWPTDNYEKSTQSLMQRAVQPGDVFMFSQELCSVPGPILTTGPVQSCQELPPLKIQQPLEGDTFVVIESMVPGGTIRVWSNDEGAEIGDGGGHTIPLIRPLEFGETLTIVQQLDETCVDSTAYQVIVK